MAHTLLLADDSVTIQRVIELTFADEDVRVVAVSDGDQAIAVLDKAPPDIVLADIGMPGRNGYQVAEHIKNTPSLAHIPVMLLTGAFEPVDQAKAAAAGCDGVLAKPFEPQLVIGRVKELLAKPKRPAAAVTTVPAPAGAKPAKLTGAAVPERLVAKDTKAEKTDYFDRLDAAFANLSVQPKATRATESVELVDETPPDQPASSTPSFDDDPVPPPRTIASAPPNRPEPVAAITASGPSKGVTMNERPVTPPTLPPLADAFAALLAAEQSAPAPTAAPAWPATPPVAAVTDDLIEQVTKRVLETLSDRVVREAVGQQVAAVAERLVREEIQKIKSAIK